MRKDKVIVLTGMMGSGKTSVGARLADLMKYKNTDLDNVIENKYGKISEIFGNKGENYFREIETEALEEFLQNANGNYILSTGGGVILSKKNREILKKYNVFYLEASPEVIYKRIANDNKRPLLKTKNPKKTIEEILNSRISLYEELGEKITTDNKTIEEVSREIYERVKRQFE